MTTLVLRNPQALMKPDIQGILQRTVESGVFLAPSGWNSVAQDIIDFVMNPQQFMILGIEAGEFKGCILGFLPHGNLFPYPTVVAIYNEGTRALSKELQAALLDHLLEAGYTRMLAVNSSGHEDAVWLKGLTPEGATGSIVGSLAMFEVK